MADYTSYNPEAPMRLVRRRAYEIAPKRPKRILVLQQRRVRDTGAAGRGAKFEWHDVPVGDNNG